MCNSGLTLRWYIGTSNPSPLPPDSSPRCIPSQLSLPMSCKSNMLRWQVMQISHKSLRCKHPSKRATHCRHTRWHNDHLETNKQLHSSKAIASFHKCYVSPSLSLFPSSPHLPQIHPSAPHLSSGSDVTHKSSLLSNAIHFPRNTRRRLLQKLGQA